MTQYLSIAESIVMLEHSVVMQLSTKGWVKEFINKVFQVLENKLPRKNCIYIISEPSSGQNVFLTVSHHSI